MFRNVGLFPREGFLYRKAPISLRQYRQEPCTLVEVDEEDTTC